MNYFKKNKEQLNTKRSVSKNLRHVFGALLLTTVFFSCETNDDTAPIDMGEVLSYNDIQGFFEANGVQDQTFSIDASAGGSVTGEDGTVVIFPPNAFVDGNNNPVTGMVDVAIKEIFKPSQMILSNTPTNAINFSSENTFLLSEGETEVKISQNGNDLLIADGINYQISVPSAGGLDPEMLPFSGTATPVEGITWNPTSDVGVNGNNMQYVSMPASYIYDVFDTGWSNCDKFYNYPGTKTTNYINLSNSPNTSETAIFLVFEENNLPAVVKFSTPYANGLQSYADMLPEGLAVTYIAITLQNNQQYLAVEEVIIANEEELTLNFEAKSTQEILDALSLLD
jgi:outer membrane protein assembly factor BamB